MNNLERIRGIHNFILKSTLLGFFTFLTACSMDAKLASLLSESPVLNVIDSDGIATVTTKGAYHIYGRCPLVSTQVSFINSPTVLSCQLGFFDGHVDLSAFPEGTNTLELHSSNGVVATWNLVVDTTAPVVLVGTPISSYTGLHKAVDIPISISESSTINLNSNDVVISGTGTNNCSATIFGSGSTTRTVRVENCDQPTGSFTVSVAAGIATDAAGNISIASNTSSSITIDNVAPLINVIATSGDTLNQSGTFTWELNFTDADSIPLSTANVALSGATANCVKTLTGTGLTQRILSITGCTGNGALTATIPAGAAKDLALNSSALVTLDPVTVDNQGPTLSLGSPSPTSGNSGTTFNWVVTYSGASNISLANTDVSFIGASTGCSASISGSGLTSRTVQVSGCTDTGTLKIQIAANSAQDGAGNQAPTSAQSAAVSLHNTAVGIAISAPLPAAINAAGTAQFTISYTNASNYTLTATDITFGGASTGCTKTLSGSGPTFTVSVTGCSSNGNVQLSVAANTANDGNGNNAPAAGPSANLAVDNTVPTIAVLGPTPSRGNTSTNFEWTLNFTDANSVGLTASNISLTGANAGCVATVSGTGLNSRVVSVTGCSGNGALDLSLAAAVITDVAGNTSAAISSLGSVTIDNTAPTLAIGTATPASGTSATEFIWAITYTGADAVSLTAGDVALTTSLTGCSVSVSGTGTTNRDVKVTGCLGDGTLKIGINAGSASDTAGNLAAASALSDQVVVNNSLPTISFATPSPTYGNSTTSFSWVLTLNDATTVPMTDSHVQLQGTTAGCIASVTGSGVAQRTVSVTGCTGTGTVAIRIAADAIKNSSNVGNAQTANSASVNISSAVPAFSVSGMPSGNNGVNSATSVTAGADLAGFVYKIGAASGVSCSTTTGFSSVQALGNTVHDLSSFGSVPMTACFKGVDAFGNYSAVFEKHWNREATANGVAMTNICGNPVSTTSTLSTTNAAGVLVDSGGSTADYNNNETCIYTITTGAPITLKLDSFDSESNYDFLYVYDGNAATAAGTEVKKYHGVQTNQTVTTTSGSMTLKWTSDSSVLKPGFIISWGGASATGSDFTPDALTLTDVINGTVATQYTRTFTVSGISGAVYAGVNGYDAELKNVTTNSSWGSWISVANGDSVSIRMTSGANMTEHRTAALRIGTSDYNWKIYWDSAAPTGSIAIANGAANSTTTSTTLNLTATDNFDGVISMYVTQTAGCASGGSWVNFAATYPWTLLNSGATNTVYVKYRDVAGNVSTCYSDSIEQDNGVPPAATLASTTPTKTNSSSATVTITFNESVTGLELGDFAATNATVSNLTGSGSSYSLTLTRTGSGPGTFSVNLKANSVLDGYNNANAVSNTLNWTYDDVGPAVTLATDSTTVANSFVVTLSTDDSEVTSVPSNSLTVTNGTATYSGSSTSNGFTSFNFSITPTAQGSITIQVAAGKFTDATGNPNTASNTLTVVYSLPPVVYFDQAASYITEGNGSTSYSIALRSDSAKAADYTVRVIRSMALSTSTQGVGDNIPLSTTVTIPANNQLAYMNYTIYGNATADGNKAIFLSLTSDSGQIRIGAKDTHVIRIQDDETTPATVVRTFASYENIVTYTADNKISIVGSGSLGYTTGSTNFTPALLHASETYIDVYSTDTSACAITSSGQLKCWGTWATGPGSGGGSGPTYRDVGTVYKKTAQNSTFSSPTCGITSDDKLRCRGTNVYDLFQIGDTAFHDEFNDVNTALRFKSATVGYRTICAITLADQLYCWGNNENGQAGVGNTATVTVPTLIDSGVTYKAVYAGGSSFCGITSLDVLKCWGANFSAQLGTGNNSAVRIPTVIDSAQTYKTVAITQYRSCGVTTANKLKCWGDMAYYNQVGIPNGLAASFDGPTAVLPSLSFTDVSGSDTICARTTDDIVLCLSSLYMSLPYNNNLHAMNYAESISKLSTHSNLTCILTTVGLVKCVTEYGNPVGDGSTDNRFQFTAIASTKTFIDVSVNGSACAVSSDGLVYCWGPSLTFNPINSPATTAVTTPKQMAAPADIRKVFVSPYTTCLLDVNGTAFCKGTNTNGSLGNGTTTSSLYSFVAVDTSAKFKFIANEADTTCGITTTDKLMCWGKNPGDGTTSSLVPVEIDAGTTYINVSMNSLTVCAVTSGNVLKCWGNDNGSMGPSPSGSVLLVPTVKDAGTAYLKLSSRQDSTTMCGITTANKLRCLTSYYIDEPTQSSTYVDIVGGSDRACVVTNAGAWDCRGNSKALSAIGGPLRGFSPIIKTH